MSPDLEQLYSGVEYYNEPDTHLGEPHRHFPSVAQAYRSTLLNIRRAKIISTFKAINSEFRPYDEMKVAVEKLFKSKRNLYYSDIARALEMDLRVVVEICQDLMQEGKVRVRQT